MKSSTDIFGLVGYPLGHSLSPAIHNSIYKNYKINSAYTLFETPPDKLRSTVEGIRSLGIKGVNVTIPFKEKIIEYLDALDEASSSIGAVNTIVNEQGILKGYNTDYYGFLKSLEHHGINTYKKDVFIIGAGGAAKAVTLCLLKVCSKVHIFGRDMEKVNRFCNDFSYYYNNIFPCVFGSIEENIEDIKPYMIVNCTPIGMKGYGNRFDINERIITGNVEILYDLVYNPYVTDFLALGKSCGCKVISGIDMLLLQAFASIKIWTGKEIDFIYGKNILQQEGIIKNM